MTLSNAFNGLLMIHARAATIERESSNPPIPKANIKIAPSNYFRNLNGPSEITMKGREFVISKNVLDASGFPEMKRGDVIRSESLGKNSIMEIREMYDLGGAIIGYRVRTE